jgi:hypothetical protein
MFFNNLSRQTIYMPVKTLFTILMLAFFSINGLATASAADICKEGKNDLVKSFEIIQGKGGMWGFMEKVSGLKEKSVIGMQADGKLRRTIGVFEEMCEDGKKPSPALYDEIQNLIGDGRMVFNMNPDRTAPKLILERINAVNEKATALLKKMGE